MRTSILAAFMLLAGVGHAGAQQTFGDWQRQTYKDPMSDADRSYAYVAGTTDTDRALAVQCMSDGLNLTYHFGRYLIANRSGQLRVEVRFDDDPALPSQLWIPSQSHDAAFAPMNRLNALLTAAKQANTVTLRVTDMQDGEQITERFSLDGLSRAITSLPCGNDDEDSGSLSAFRVAPAYRLASIGSMTTPERMAEVTRAMANRPLHGR